MGPGPVTAPTPAPMPAPPTRRVAILSVGDELVTGDLVDTNAGWIARRARGRGHEVCGIEVVPDDVAAIAAAVQRARAAAHLLIVSGGLGPTADDVTRDGVAAALGRTLRPDEAALAGLRAIHGPKLSRGNAQQALFPDGARVLDNPLGTAPGFVVRVDDWLVACVPGVPSEMKPMVAALLDEVTSQGRVEPTRRLLACGLAESKLGELLADLMGPRLGATVGITVARAVHTISIRGDDAAAITEVEHEVQRRLGSHLFGAGADRLEDVVVQRLLERRLTITTAESCTGGLLAAAITSVPGSSDVFREAVVAYANEAKMQRLGVAPELLAEHGAVSEPLARAMAIGQRERAGADLAVAITGIAGPGGGSAEKPVGTVFIAVATAERVDVHHRRWRGARDEIRERAVNIALDLVRRGLIAG